MVKNKRGPKQKVLFGCTDRFVDTWSKLDDKWCYIGKSRQHLAGTTDDGTYRYYISGGIEMRQSIN